MKGNTALPILIIASVMGVALNIGTQFYRHNDTNKQFCAQDTAIVSIFQQSLAGITPAQAQKTPAEYEKYRLQYTGYINKFADLAPCHVDRTVPPDLLIVKR